MLEVLFLFLFFNVFRFSWFESFLFILMEFFGFFLIFIWFGGLVVFLVDGILGVDEWDLGSVWVGCEVVCIRGGDMFMLDLCCEGIFVFGLVLIGVVVLLVFIVWFEDVCLCCIWLIFFDSVCVIGRVLVVVFVLVGECRGWGVKIICEFELFEFFLLRVGWIGFFEFFVVVGEFVRFKGFICLMIFFVGMLIFLFLLMECFLLVDFVVDVVLFFILLFVYLVGCVFFFLIFVKVWDGWFLLLVVDLVFFWDVRDFFDLLFVNIFLSCSIVNCCMFLLFK